MSFNLKLFLFIGFPAAVAGYFWPKCSVHNHISSLAFPLSTGIEKVDAYRKEVFANIQNSCQDKCSLTGPDFERLHIKPADQPKYFEGYKVIPSKPCSCTVKELPKATLNAIDGIVPGKTKICRIHLDVKALDSSNGRGTISNILTVPYFSGCASDLLNDQMKISLDPLMSYSKDANSLTYQSTAECDGGDGDAHKDVHNTLALVLGLTAVYLISLYGSYILGKKNIDIKESVLRIFAKGYKESPPQGKDNHYQQLVE